MDKTNEESIFMIIKERWDGFTDILKKFLVSACAENNIDDIYKEFQIHLFAQEEQYLTENDPQCFWISSLEEEPVRLALPRSEEKRQELEAKAEAYYDARAILKAIQDIRTDINIRDYAYKGSEKIGVSGISYKYKIEKPAMKYGLLWFGFCAPNASVKAKIICQMVVNFLAEFINDLRLIVELDNDEWEKRSGQIGFDYIKAYKDAIFEKYRLPDEEFIKKVAAERYETRENNAILCIADDRDVEKIEQQKRYISFAPQCADEYRLVMDKISAIRKMLEVCNDKQGALVAVWNKDVITLRGVTFHDNILNGVFHDMVFIQFLGRGGWKLYICGNCILMYKNMLYYTDDRYSGDQILDKINHIDAIPKDKKKAFQMIMQRLLSVQKHGALVIIINDAQREAERLCKCKRGMLVEKIDLTETEEDSTKTEEAEYINLNLLDGMAAIDGAVVIDFAGICYGFGIILDGDAAPGDIGRGARYNSAVSYIAGREAKYAVIMSEDKERGLEIIDNSGNRV